MRHRILLVLAACTAVAAPALASAGTQPGAPWSVTLQAWGGYSRYDVLGLRPGLGDLGEDDPVEDGFESTGVSALLRLGWLDLCVLYEGQLLREKTDSAVLTPLVGIAWNLTPFWRLDLLGELGGHRISNVGRAEEGADYEVRDPETVWLPYVGVRPTLSVRAPLGPSRLVLSVAPFARWDLVEKEIDVEVTTGTTTSVRSYDAGGSTFGVVAGLGLEF
jgi:hypothetical protein